MSLTRTQTEVLLARAIVELADGSAGPGVAHAHSIVALADKGLLPDPTALPQPKGSGKALSAGDALTNGQLDRGNPATVKPKLADRLWGRA